MNLKLHTKGIRGSGLAEPGEPPAALFGVVVEVDGNLLLSADKVDLTFEEGIVRAQIFLSPASIEVVAHDKESWERFDDHYDAEWRKATARTGMGQAIARHTVE